MGKPRINWDRVWKQYLEQTESRGVYRLYALEQIAIEEIVERVAFALREAEERGRRAGLEEAAEALKDNEDVFCSRLEEKAVQRLLRALIERREGGENG